MSIMNNRGLWKSMQLLGCLAILGLISFRSEAGNCIPTDGTQSYLFPFIHTLTDPIDNHPGLELDDVYSWDNVEMYRMTCSCTGRFKSVFYTARPLLSPGHAGGGKQWYRLNRFLDVAFEVFIQGGVNRYIPVPFTDFDNQYTLRWLRCNTPVPNFGSGAKGKVSLYFVHSFVGKVAIPLTDLIEIYAGTTVGTPASGQAVSRVSMIGSVTVPQSCEIEAGSIITIDFNEIAPTSFQGRGQKAKGVTPRTNQLLMRCNNIARDVKLNMSFVAEADPNYPDAVKTTKPEVGIVITDDKGRIITPNSGELPIDYHFESNTGQVTIQSYPVSTNGKEPDVGPFTGRATIFIDFY